MKTLICIILTCLILTSCSSQKRTTKRIERFLKKVPPIEVASHLTKNNPELFKHQTIHFRDTIKDTILVTVPEISHDTLYLPSDSNRCKLIYIDKNLKLKITEEGKIHYDILQREVETIYIKVIDTLLVAQPCPQQAVIDKIVKENKEKEFENLKLKSEKKSLWIWIIILAALLVVENLLLFRFKMF